MGQIDSLLQIRVSGGVSNPRAPGAFYDYWKNGFDAELAAEFNYSDDFEFVGAVEYSSFSFSQDRFFQKIKVSDIDVSMSGGKTSLFVLSGNFKYILYESAENQKIARPYLFLGGGILFSNISRAEIQYPLSPAAEEGGLSVAPCIRTGCGVMSSMTPTTSWIAEITYLYGITTSQKVNTDYFTIRGGIAFTP